MGAVIGAWAVVVLSVFYGGKPVIGTIEWVSIAGAIIGIILWQWKGAIYAIICSQAAVFIGAFPTFAEAYANPAQEDPIAWSIWLISCLFALATIKKWNLANALQPITFTTIETIMVILVVVRPFFL